MSARVLRARRTRRQPLPPAVSRLGQECVTVESYGREMGNDGGTRSERGERFNLGLIEHLGFGREEPHYVRQLRVEASSGIEPANAGIWR